MKSIICTLYNSTTGHHSPPIVFETKQQAITHFINEIQSPNSELANIKDTLTIYSIGDYDHKTGKVSQYFLNRLKLLITGKEVTLNTPKGE